ELLGIGKEFTIKCYVFYLRLASSNVCLDIIVEVENTQSDRIDPHAFVRAVKRIVGLAEIRRIDHSLCGTDLSVSDAQLFEHIRIVRFVRGNGIEVLNGVRDEPFT